MNNYNKFKCLKRIKTESIMLLTLTTAIKKNSLLISV